MRGVKVWGASMWSMGAGGSIGEYGVIVLTWTPLATAPLATAYMTTGGTAVDSL